MKFRFFILGSITTILLLTLLGALGMPTGAEMLTIAFGDQAVWVYAVMAVLLAGAIFLAVKG
ncbi:hypothetical protein CR205_03540 [Alteribacter lacisalsi]|uniref:Uncharacterized protein n=1 Tax=Alteribacter lacisalsi TaxID=2045244 RepID=A0A2W0HLD6_9BACI|nr:hypothetical protein [Alteribacter lacisalsi]PYZ97679.1 hypothetical protein CR205_03540 [Alteribacter lacisalsi]